MRTGDQESMNQRRATLKEMLTVVEDEQTSLLTDSCANGGG
jgi:hypothetical protein